MKTKHTNTLRAIFAKPTTATLEWVRIEALFIALDCRVIEGRGSRVRFEFNGKVVGFIDHTPPKKPSPTKLNKHVNF